jgi:hypothetical protein
MFVFVQYDRLTPRLLSTCRKNLVDLCELPTNWSMGTDMKDVQVGKYLSCLYQNKQKVKMKENFIIEFI